MYAGALDGKLRVFDARNGKLLRVIETKLPYQASNGVAGHGGAIDVGGVLVNGDQLFVLSGLRHVRPDAGQHAAGLRARPGK